MKNNSFIYINSNMTLVNKQQSIKEQDTKIITYYNTLFKIDPNKKEVKKNIKSTSKKSRKRKEARKNKLSKKK